MESLKEAGKELSKSRVLILGLTFKEDVPDLRNSKAKELLVELKRNNVEVLIHDPIANPEFISSFFGQKNNTIDELNNLDAIIVFSPHKEFKELTLEKLKSFMNEKPILFDVKRFYNKEEAKKLGKKYLSL
jgi:UDP-N-acetyl-D-mannosaminuronate dehydrogenase